MRYNCPIVFRKNYLFFLALLIINVCFVLYIVQEKNYVDQAKEVAVHFKANFLKDSVTNFIHEFERNKEDSTEIFDFAVSERQNILDEQLSRAWSVQAVQSILDKVFTAQDPRGMWGYVLVTGLNEEIAASQNVPANWDRIPRSLDNIFCAWREVENPVGRFYFGVTQEHLYNTMVSIVSSKIYNSHFVEETYYWINEIKNYKGGKNYAVRLIHPNPRSSEGMMLSTDMQDAVGDRPYERELEGINKDGEVLSSYYFKKKDSDNFARKITYSKLYKPYNWVVSMGSYYDDIYDYVQTVGKTKGRLVARFAIPIMALLDIAFIVLLFLKVHSEKKSESDTKVLTEQNASRARDAKPKEFGEQKLAKDFLEFKQNERRPAIMAMDIDDFKTINETYGADAGDFVLAQMANIFYEKSRSSDVLIRWEGDKFIGIFTGMQKADCWRYAQKLLDAIASKRIAYKDKSIPVTVSLGFSFFDEEDKSYEQALERAQKALKDAKAAGKSRARVE